MSDERTATDETLLLLNEAISLGRRDGMAGQHLDAMCSARDEIERLRGVLLEVRRDIEESADDVVWMRGGIETVCDRITAVLGDQHEQE